MTQSCENAHLRCGDTGLGVPMQTTKLEMLRMMNPWPDIRALDGQPSYVWSLDGGGRLESRNVSLQHGLQVAIGVFT